MAKKKEYTDIKLVKTDYDNMRNLKFFINQHKKALEMIDEVNSFYNSFIKSKLITSKKLIKDEFIIVKIEMNPELDIKYSGIITFGNDFGGYEYNSFESDIEEYIDSLGKKKLDEYDISCINKRFSKEFFEQLYDIAGISQFIIAHDKTLIQIPRNAKYEFKISDDETQLSVTFVFVNKYKKHRTPGWLPWTVDTTHVSLVYDTTTNNMISYDIKMNTHEEQDRANRGY